jgi:hypothetical protein
MSTMTETYPQAKYVGRSKAMEAQRECVGSLSLSDRIRTPRWFFEP